MIAVVNTTPINYLVLIGEIHILPRLYTRVVIPAAVYDELTHHASPDLVREWISNHPEWLEIRQPINSSALCRLDLGESQAISLASEIGEGVLLMDDYAGRREAVRLGLKVAGTLSILDEADTAGLLKFEDVITRLRKTSFRVSQAVIAVIVQRRSH